MITGAPDVESLYDTEQLPELRVHVEVENTPVPLLLDQPTEPVGESPVTVAVHSVGVPVATDGGLQLTPVLEAPAMFTEP